MEAGDSLKLRDRLRASLAVVRNMPDRAAAVTLSPIMEVGSSRLTTGELAFIRSVLAASGENGSLRGARSQTTD